MTIETARRASLEFVCIFGHDGVGRNVVLDGLDFASLRRVSGYVHITNSKQRKHRATHLACAAVASGVPPSSREPRTVTCDADDPRRRSPTASTAWSRFSIPRGALRVIERFFESPCGSMNGSSFTLHDALTAGPSSQRRIDSILELTKDRIAYSFQLPMTEQAAILWFEQVLART